MELAYLLFDFSDDSAGHGSFDAMASVPPARLAPLLAEVAQVLGWAWDRFGAPGEDAPWDMDLQADAQTRGTSTALQAHYDSRRGEVTLGKVPASDRITVTLTLGGTPGFCEALRAAFALD